LCSNEAFPSELYNYGGVTRGAKQISWAFTSIEYIFDVLLVAGLKKNGYSLFGHSAGAQFAHRFVLFSPVGSRCLQVVSANAGWYTMPKVDQAAYMWPYSLVKCPAKTNYEHMFSRKLLVLLGQEDTGSKYLRVSEGAMEQGSTRFERGVYFFMQARQVAAKMGVRFNWALRTVPNVGHSNKHMAYVAASHLFSVSMGHTNVHPRQAGQAKEAGTGPREGEEGDKPCCHVAIAFPNSRR